MCIEKLIALRIYINIFRWCSVLLAIYIILKLKKVGNNRKFGEKVETVGQGQKSS